ncbi:EAL domain-containing protein [Aerosakkonemataceae cyanobacterium BLCC-F154]|uniref:EAL domain-containing protein n=1 Tax=Floridaenema fluviatile BLCC-F154 TaxID=3153640 RepID=A0ABV4YBH9_9CYAN
MEAAKILVVEDEAIVAIDLQTTLEELEYIVIAIVDSGELAIEKAQEEQPDLVLMDIRLAGEMDGIEAAETIRTQLGIPVVYLTAYADKETLKRAKLTLPFGYLIKPFEERELQTTIEMALYKHQIEKQLREKSQWFTAILTSIGDGVIANDRKACITFMNPIAETLTGWQQEEAIGKDLAEVLQIIDETDRTPIQIPLAETLEAGNTVNLPSQTLLVAKNGKVVPIGDSAAPIKDRKGKIKGSVFVFRDISAQKLAEAKLAYQAFHDALTNLPNRALFLHRLEQATQRSKQQKNYLFAVLFLDVDRFKFVNDSLGHFIGDKLLIAIASRIKNSLNNNDLVARLGGDEFAIILENVANIKVVCSIANQIVKELSLPFIVEDYEIFTNASIGIVMSSEIFDGIESLLRNADIAMYRAKRVGGACYQVYDRSMHTQVVAQLQLETDLRKAIERQEFTVYYQPIFSLTNYQIVGFEALVRWQHPQRGLMNPGEFINLAEETGLILQIDWLVLHQACQQMKLWQEELVIPESFTVSVNFSGKQFAQANLVEQITRVLQITDLNPSFLRLEITEGAIIENPEAAIAVINQLRNLGIKIYIDDFGTGYSSLSYLHRFPIDTLKVDRSFVTRIDNDINSLEISKAIVILAHNLGMEAVAEGIETLQQLTKLRELKCEYGQGYLFSAPVNQSEATMLIISQMQNFQGE